jgi:hypothetical protein
MNVTRQETRETVRFRRTNRAVLILIGLGLMLEKAPSKLANTIAGLNKVKLQFTIHRSVHAHEVWARQRSACDNHVLEE